MNVLRMIKLQLLLEKKAKYAQRAPKMFSLKGLLEVLVVLIVLRNSASTRNIVKIIARVMEFALEENVFAWKDLKDLLVGDFIVFFGEK